MSASTCPLCGGNFAMGDARMRCSMCDYMGLPPKIRRETPADRMRRMEAARAPVPQPRTLAAVPVEVVPAGPAPVACPIDGWPLARVGDDEPRILDVELAERLGYQRPRAIRELIERMVADGKLNGSELRRIVRQTGGRPATEFWLTEEQALLVATQSETSKAWALTREIVRVFRLARAGLFPATPPSPAPAPALPPPPRTDDRLDRIERVLERLVLAQAVSRAPRRPALPAARGGVFIPVVEATEETPAHVGDDEIRVLANGRRAA